MYAFDIYIRAAVEIQRVYRGFIARRSVFRMIEPTLKNYKFKVIRIQRKIRQFLKLKRQKYAQFADYLAMKSKKIMINIKHFYKINSKFDSMRKFAPKSKQVNKDQKIWLQKADCQVQYLETGFDKIKQRSYMNDF